MAEPLLRKTFSRFRGKEKLRRKKSELKDRDQPSTASEMVPASSDPEPSQAVSRDSEDVCRKGTSITVSRKQNWAKVSSSAKEDRSSFCRKLLGGHHTSTEQPDRPGRQGNCLPSQLSDAGLGANQRPSKAISLFRSQSCPQRTNRDRAFFSGNHHLRQEEVQVSGKYSGVDFLSSSVEKSQSVLDYTEICPTSSVVKCSSHGAYLQSLDRSSREWVLSSGKVPGFEEGLRFPLSSIGELKESNIVDDEGDIWYNPIPEEENLSSLLDKSDPWKRRSARLTDVAQHSAKGSQTPSNATDLLKKASSSVEMPGISLSPSGGTESSCTRADYPQALSEVSYTTSPAEGDGSQKAEASGSCLHKPTGTAQTDVKIPSESRGTVSKGKSPSTVRRLSMKMKKLPELRRKLSLRSTRTNRQDQSGGSSPQNLPKESGNILSRYHLDTSVSSRESLWRSRARQKSKSTIKGGYLSDGDSPELIVKTEKCSTNEQEEESLASDSQGGAGSKLDSAAFRTYSINEHPRCVQHLSGLVNVHLYGLQDAKSPKVDSKDIFCALQVDGVNRAHTALLPCKAPFLSLNHTFNLELESSQYLKLIVFSWDHSTCKNRVCCYGTISLPQIFKGSRCQQLAVKLEPRGLLYAKLTLVEQWETPAAVIGSHLEPRVFGVELCQLVEREDTAVRVPLLIQKCVSEIEKRGLKVVGLYRLCGSAAVKKELRDAFERDSSTVVLSEELYPDINVVTGILKDYLRELPTPLITKTLYEVVLKAMSKRPPRRRGQEPLGSTGEETVALLNCLPETEKATLTTLLDHLSLVSSYHEYNRMTSQNIAVCFGPVLLNQNQDPSRQRSRSYAHCEEIVNAVDFKRHIEVLHYLLQVWPNPRRKILNFRAKVPSKPTSCLRQKEPPRLALDILETEVVARNRCRGLESPPTNRYAGDWSICGQDYLLMPAGGLADADYDEVAATDSENEEENLVLDLREGFLNQRETLFVGDFALVEDSEAVDLESPFSPRLNLKDFDALILDLERELSKQINICL